MEEVILVNSMEEYIEISNGADDRFELIQEDEEGGKHDMTYHSVLIKHIESGRYFGLDFETSYNDGIDPCDTLEFPMELKEVEVTPVISFTWKPKK